MAEVKNIRPLSPQEVEDVIEKSFDKRQPVLLLFDDISDGLHDSFLQEYLSKRTRAPSLDFLVHIDGDKVRTADDFYTQCRRSIPLADYMGSNLDALADVLRVEALSPDPKFRTMWVWSNAHILYSNDPPAFQQIFEVMSDCSLQALHGESGSLGSVDLPARFVALLLTGKWAAMGEEASRDDSFFYWLRKKWFKPLPLNEPTRLLTVRISR